MSGTEPTHEVDALPGIIAETSAASPAWRRLGSLLTALAGLGGLAAASLWGVELFRDPGFMPLGVVRIEGQFRHASRDQLQAAITGPARRGFFSIDVDAVRHAAESLAWIETVRVRRIWPDTLHIVALEHEPLARWGQKQLLSARGELFQPPEGVDGLKLPLLDGPEGTHRQVMERFLDTRRLLGQAGLELRQLAVNPRWAWTLTISEGAIVRLGRKSFEERLHRFVEAYPALLKATEEGRRPSEIDLRYTNGFSVHYAAGGKPNDADHAERADGFRPLLSEAWGVSTWVRRTGLRQGT